MPIVHGLEQEYAGRITVVRANIHNKVTLALQEQYGFTATPEFFLVDGDGNILGHWDDGATIASLRQAIDDILEAPS